MSGKHRGRLLQLAVLGLGLGAAALLYWGKPAPQPTVDKPRPAPVVDVVPVVSGPLRLVVRTQGTVEPRREIDLVAQVAGKVDQVSDSFVEGGFFASGQVLVQLEQQDYRFATQRARAQLADARQLLALEKGRVRQAKREWRDLGDSDANELFLREPQLASAEAAVAAAQADLEQAELNLQRTGIQAPFDGRVMQQFVDLGQYVAPGTAVARIYSTDTVEVRLPLSDRQLALLDLSLRPADDKPHSLAIPVDLRGRFAGRDWHWEGTITRSDAGIDSRSRVMYLVAEIPHPFEPDLDSGRPPLMIGQFVRAAIAGRRMDDAVALPRAALRPQDRLWLVNAENQLVILPVTLLQAGDEEVVVQGQFPPGSQVVVSTLNVVTPGMPVTPRSLVAEREE